jgi:simple sugar transport system ATP-binding protein
VLILDEPTAALGVKEATHVLRIIMQARQKGIAVIFVTHNVLHAMSVGDHFAVLIRGEKADDFRKGERTREQITDLMAGGEAMAALEAELAEMQAAAIRPGDGRPAQAGAEEAAR